ncbi:hypothetical protein H1R20_g5888, partial [Candolleomyces eurysporus]
MRHYTGVVAILIESALPLSVFGLITAILQQNGKPRSSLSAGYSVCDALFAGLFYSFCSLAPHMIIFRVTSGRSFTKFPSSKDGSPLEFAHQGPEASFLQSGSNAGGNAQVYIVEEGRDASGDMEKAD